MKVMVMTEGLIAVMTAGAVVVTAGAVAHRADPEEAAEAAREVRGIRKCEECESVRMNATSRIYTFTTFPYFHIEKELQVTRN